MRPLPIAFPFGGLTEAKPGTDGGQRNTLGPCENVRPRDPRTGQVRGAQRSGLSKFAPEGTPLSTQKVQRLAVVSVENETIQYAKALQDDWAKDTESETAPRNIDRDSVGNVYYVDQRNLVKVNGDGEELWKVAVPLPSNEHTLGALRVTPEGLVLVGIREGGDPSQARLWAYVQDDTAPRLLWELETDAFIADCAVAGGLLFVLTNDEAARRCELKAYGNYTLAIPSESWTQRVPYPGNALAPRPDGTLSVVHEPFDNRYLDPNLPGVGAALEGWTPDDASEGDFRVWAWFSAADIQLQDGEEVAFWGDRSGNNRHLFAFADPQSASGTEANAPTFNPIGVGGQPSVRFNGEQGLRTLGNPSTDVEQRDRQRTLLPGYEGSQYVVIIVARPVADATKDGLLLHQDVGANNRHVWVNRDQAGAPLEGGVYLEEDPATDIAGSGLTAVQEAGSFVNSQGEAETLILTYMSDGGVNPTSGLTGTRSLFRTQGKPLARWISEANEFDTPTFLGTDGTALSGNNFEGEVAEILVLERKEVGTTFVEPLLIDHPAYPSVASPIISSGQSAEDAATLLEQLEGWAAWKYGAASVFDATETYDPPGSNGEWPHPYGTNLANRLGVPTTEETEDLNVFLDNGGIVSTWSNNGRLEWALAYANGVGYGAVADSDGNVYSWAPNSIQQVLASGELGGWNRSAGGNLVWRYPRLAVDTFDNVYLPIAATAGFALESVVSYSKELGIIDVAIPGFGVAGRQTYGVAVPSSSPDYGMSPVERASHLWLIGDKFLNTGAVDNDQPHVQRWDLISRTEIDLPPRRQQIVGVSSGKIYEANMGGNVEILGGSFAENPRYVSGAVLFGEAFFTDGVSYLVYNGKEASVSTFKSKSSGDVPSGCKLMAAYRGRLVLAAGSDPWQWFMSKAGDPYNWDFLPPVRSATQAVSGATAEGPGRMPDKITALIPYSDDVLVVGCDSSIYQFSGDPAAGGAIDVVSDTIGVAFGDAWCRDDRGLLYFLSNEGELYRMAPGSRPEPLSDGRVTRLLRGIDLETYQIKLGWNPLERAVHIFTVPLIHQADKDNAPDPTHYYYDPTADFWGTDRVSHPFVIPTAVLQYDGDFAGDRALLIGCMDGFIRKVDPEARSDDGFPIESIVRTAPIVLNQRANSRVGTLEVELDAYQDGAIARLYVSRVVTRPGQAIASTKLRPGANGTRAFRGQGKVAWLEIFNRRPNQTWAFENATIEAETLGRVRN